VQVSIESKETLSSLQVKELPKGLAVVALLGPSIIWCAEYIGSGEVILATRTGAVLGMSVLWAVVMGVFLKFWIGLSAGRYTVCTGEGMIDMFDRIPGPRHWVVWVVLVVQFIAGALSMGALASAAGAFIKNIIPIPAYIGGWLIAVFAVVVAWSGLFSVLKVVMSVLVLLIIVGVLYVAAHVFPGFSELLGGLTFQLPAVPHWASAEQASRPSGWSEILPLLGWGAGGFASQVWYTYWVLGANYGACAGRGYGRPADLSMLGSMSRATAEKIKKWCRVVYADASIALVIGIVVTGSFFIAGAGILRPNRIAPEGQEVALKLSTIFSSKWGSVGGFLFMLSGAAAMTSTLVGQLAGWPRLLADSFRICILAFRKFSWKRQFRFFLVLFLFTNMIIVYTLGMKPVFLVKLGALCDGLVLIPLQALCVAIGLFVVMPKMLSKEGGEVLRPSWILGVGLLLAFLVFSYCILKLPSGFL